MKTVIVIIALLLLPLPAVAQKSVITSSPGPCPDEPCGCGGPAPVVLTTYFVPNYSGWQTAKRLWTSNAGGTSERRMFSYATNKYELIKNATGTATETFRVDATWVYVTSEMGTPLGSSPKIFLGNGLTFMPTVLCTNKPTFRMCHSGEQLVFNTSCLPNGQTSAHCAINTSRVDLAPGWNYGYNVGVVDSVIKTDVLDNGEIEKYWYGKNKGILRWEHRNASNVLLAWDQQTGEIANSPIPHNSCAQP
jgi:hypothetical protein